MGIWYLRKKISFNYFFNINLVNKCKEYGKNGNAFFLQNLPLKYMPKLFSNLLWKKSYIKKFKRGENNLWKTKRINKEDFNRIFN